MLAWRRARGSGVGGRALPEVRRASARARGSTNCWTARTPHGGTGLAPAVPTKPTIFEGRPTPCDLYDSPPHPPRWWSGGAPPTPTRHRRSWRPLRVQHPTRSDDERGRRAAAADRIHPLDGVEDVGAVEHPPKDHVLAVEPRGLRGGARGRHRTDSAQGGRGNKGIGATATGNPTPREDQQAGEQSTRTSKNSGRQRRVRHRWSLHTMPQAHGVAPPTDPALDGDEMDPPCRHARVPPTHGSHQYHGTLPLSRPKHLPQRTALKVMKNCAPLVLGPLLAIDSTPRLSCVVTNGSSSNFPPG